MLNNSPNLFSNLPSKLFSPFQFKISCTNFIDNTLWLIKAFSMRHTNILSQPCRHCQESALWNRQLDLKVAPSIITVFDLINKADSQISMTIL